MTISEPRWYMDNIGNFCCVTCNKKYQRRSGVNQHFRYSCLNKKQFECEYCHKKYSRKDSLQQHKMIHGDLPYYDTKSEAENFD